MRLICPNCGAQYEVPDDVIPEAGRDVQCSNCGHTWFERPGASLDDDDLTDGAAAAPDDPAEAESGPDDASPQDDWFDPDPTERPDAARDRAEDAPTADWPAATPPIPEPDTDTDTDSEAEPEADPAPTEAPAAEVEPGPAPAPAPAPAGEDGRVTRTRRRALDPEVASVLQEERAFSESSRRRDSPPAFESQGDLALDEGEDDARRRRADRLRGATETDDSAQRRELLPDIEEINSSLRPTQEAAADTSETREEAEERGRRRGFRVGFALMLFLAAALTLAYGNAARLAAAFPPAAPALTAYAESIDEGRLWLDLRLQQFLDSMETEAE